MGARGRGAGALYHPWSPRLQPATIPRLIDGSRLSECADVMTDGAIGSGWSRLQNRFEILTDGSRRAATRWSWMLWASLTHFALCHISPPRAQAMPVHMPGAVGAMPVGLPPMPVTGGAVPVGCL